MSTVPGPNLLNSAPFLRNSRHFPPEVNRLVLEVNKAYIDTANCVNKRTVSIFPTLQTIVNGEFWFLAATNTSDGTAPRQGIRRVYQFDDSNLVFDHNINLNGVSNFVRIWGTFYDGTFWQALPYVDVVNVSNQINIKVSSTQVIVTKGAGAPPAINRGLIILEWIANP